MMRRQNMQYFFLLYLFGSSLTEAMLLKISGAQKNLHRQKMC